MPRLLLLAPLALALAACGSDPAPEAADAQASGGAPPVTEDVTEPPGPAAGPNEVLTLYPADVGVVTVTSEGDSYDVSPERGEVVFGIDGRPAAPEAVQTWLARFAPLEAAGRYSDAAPEALEQDYTALLVFTFSDGSARSLYLQTREDGVAALSQPDGPVWRLEPGAYADLVPPADALSQ